MDLSKEDIKQIEEKAEDIPFAIFTSKDAGKTFICHYSSLNDFKSNDETTIYRLKPLQRLIGKKLDLFTSGLQKELSEEDQRLPIVLNWEGIERQVLILDMDSTLVSETMTIKIEEIKNLIKKILSN